MHNLNADRLRTLSNNNWGKNTNTHSKNTKVGETILTQHHIHIHIDNIQFIINFKHIKPKVFTENLKRTYSLELMCKNIKNFSLTFIHYTSFISDSKYHYHMHK